MKFIDVHAHAPAFPQFAPLRHYDGMKMMSVEMLLERYDAYGVEKGVLLPIVSPEAEHQLITCEETAWIVSQHPDRFAWFCNVDPRGLDNSPSCNLGYLLEHYKKLGAKGVGEVTANLYFDDPYMENLLYHASELDMPVLIHISTGIGKDYGIVDELGLPRIEKMLKKYPKLKVIGHSQAFWSEISGDNTDAIRGGYNKTPVVPGGAIRRLMEECDNLYCDLSAGSGYNSLNRDHDHAAQFLNDFYERIYFGCDLCGETNQQLKLLTELLERFYQTGRISEAVYRRIAYENAQNLIK